MAAGPGNDPIWKSDPEIVDAFIERLREGYGRNEACLLSDFKYSTMQEWRRISKLNSPDDYHVQVSDAHFDYCKGFIIRMDEAEDVARSIRIERAQKIVERAALEGFTKTKVKKVEKADGSIETTEEVEVGNPIWQAACRLLEAIDPERWARREFVRLEQPLTAEQLERMRAVASDDEWQQAARGDVKTVKLLLARVQSPE